MSSARADCLEATWPCDLSRECGAASIHLAFGTVEKRALLQTLYGIRVDSKGTDD